MAAHEAAGIAGGSPQHTQIQAEPSAFVWDRDEQIKALSRLREKFPEESIAKRPQVICGDCTKAQYKACQQHPKAKCGECGQYVSPKHIHLSYVGHAEATDRLLEVDPLWEWEPLAYDANGLPLFTENGLWIRLTVCGMTRLGFGDAGEKRGPNAVKEVIGDALRNAGMRFGMALDLWAKTDLREAEPSEADKFLEQLRRPDVWNTRRALEIIRKRIADAGLSEHVAETAGWQTLDELADGRLREMDRIDAEREQRRAAGQQASSTPSQQGVGSPEAAQPAPAQQAAPVQQLNPDPMAAEVAALEVRVSNAWNHLGGTEMNLREAEAKRLLDATVSGPDGQKYAIGALLQGRINELKAYQAQGQEAA